MSNKKITDLASLASATSDDVLVIVDTATNTTKKITKGDFVSDVTSTPAGSNGQIQFNSSSAFGADSNLYWDNTNKRLGVGTNSPGVPFEVLGDALVNAADLSDAKLTIGNPSRRWEIVSKHGGAYYQIKYVGGGTYQTISYLGNVGFGNDTPTARLQVKGSGSTSATTSLLVQNSSGTSGLTVFDNGNVSVGSSANSAYQLYGNGSWFNGGSIYSSLYYFNTISPGAGGSTNLYGNSNNFKIGSSATATASAIFEVDSTTKGFLPPRQLESQRTAIASPAVGLMVYQTDGTEGLYVYKSTGWTFVA